jgi:hypothetical protein
MRRIIFKKGGQRAFIDLVLSNLDCPSVRGLLQFGFKINYSTLKNYYSERRCLPFDLFSDLCFLAKIDFMDLDYSVLDSSWGQVLGGEKSRRGRKIG